MALDRACGLDHRFEPAVGGPEVPLLEERSGRLGGGLFVEVLEGQPDLIGARGLQMMGRQAVEGGLLPLRQVGGIAQPDVACAAQRALRLLFGSTHLIDSLIDDLDGVEFVEGDGGLGQVVGDALDEGRAHVDADFADGLGRAAMGCEVLDERGDRGGVAAFGGEQHSGLVDIDEQRDIVVTAPRGGLVDGDPRDADGVGARSRLIDVVMDHAPQFGVVLADDPGDGLDRHRRDHGHHHRLEQQGEAAVGSRPWHGDLLDAAFLAAHARHTGVQISLVLEEIEVSPGHPLGVVGRAVLRAAGRAGEAAAWPEVDLDIQAMRLGVEVGAHHGPWRRQAERLLHQRRIVHACLCILSAEPS